VRTLARRLAALPFRVLPRRLRRHVVKAALHAAAAGAPAAGLRELLAIEADLQGIVDETAMRYEGGIHPKHRLTRYHDFFVERVRAGERVLDVGCGYGAVAYSVAVRAAAVVVGVDIDPGNIAAARRRYTHPRLTFVVGDATRDVGHEGFDVVIASNLIEHLDDRAAFYRALQARARPRRWLVRVPMVDREWQVSLRRELGLPYFSDVSHFTEYTRQSFEAEVHAAGFAVTHLQVNWGEIWAELSPSHG
jgi:SAM-dependent methyltransferase